VIERFLAEVPRERLAGELVEHDRSGRPFDVVVTPAFVDGADALDVRVDVRSNEQVRGIVGIAHRLPPQRVRTLAVVITRQRGPE